MAQTHSISIKAAAIAGLCLFMTACQASPSGADRSAAVESGSVSMEGNAGTGEEEATVAASSGVGDNGEGAMGETVPGGGTAPGTTTPGGNTAPGTTTPAGSTAPAGSTTPDGSAVPTGSTTASLTGTLFDLKAAENLGADRELLLLPYFKAGDPRRHLSFRFSDVDPAAGELECSFSVRDPKYPDRFGGVNSAKLETEPGVTSYPLSLSSQGSASITFGLDESVPKITVQGGGDLDGDYYCLDRSFSYPSVFSRRLCHAELRAMPTEVLWLLRNEVYAAYGRKFDNPTLSEYFSKFSWYRGTVNPSDFSDAVLSDIEKYNINLIHDLEQERSDGHAREEDVSYSIENFPFAPYLKFLDKYDETGLQVFPVNALDKGAYYVVNGCLFIPASITWEQYQTLQNGGEVDVTVNELSGKTRRLKKDPNGDKIYGYLLYDSSSDAESDGVETGLTPDMLHGTFRLWQTSADTVMNTVYAGNIYILKGAVMGFSTSLSDASRYQQEIPFGQEAVTGLSVPDVINANHLYHNGRGCFTAVYYLGD